MSDYFPPTVPPSQHTVRLITEPLVPGVAADPNNKPAVYQVPLGASAGIDAAFKITLLTFHNPHTTDTYSVAWGHSYNPYQIWAPSQTNGALHGTSDPNVETGRIDLEPGDIAEFDSPILLYPGEVFFANQAKKGTVLGRAVTLRITGVWEPL
jgi:hypothetical protein